MKNDPRNPLIISLREKGFTFAYIARKLGLTRQRVHQLFQGQNIAKREKVIKPPPPVYPCIFCEKGTSRKGGLCSLCASPIKNLEGRERTRELVRIRDKHTCQNCKKVWTSGRRFDVHHLNGVCGKKTRSYDSIFDLLGLITLCHKCHYHHPEHSQRISGKW